MENINTEKSAEQKNGDGTAFPAATLAPGSRITTPDTAHLFAPLKIRDVRLRNRILVSPMCQYSSVDGYANEWHLVHLGSRAIGGAAAVLTEAAAVLPEGRISPEDLGIWSDDHIDMLARIFRFIETQGAVPGMQLAHAGRKASVSAPWKGDRPLAQSEGGWQPIFAPSAIPFADGYTTPRELTGKQIQRLIAAFADGARRALEAGSRLLEIHAAHGYLLHEFLSPLSNHREDSYGGTFENRTRIVRQIVEAVRNAWPERYPLFVRISATDWVDGGWTIEDSVALAKQLQPLGVDMLDCSSGGLLPRVPIPTGPGYQVPFAKRIRTEANILTAGVGMITEPEQADQIIRSGQADMVLLAREFLRDPYWPLHAARRLGQEIFIPAQYRRAF
jgi:2,4-dienoyl-CoA reductase-like NADH-dependent reductase (Old Yellow Enzyme family)